MTALGMVEAIEAKPGQTVLIAGATGGVGVFALQLAAARGASVVAVARPDAAELIRALGAERTVDHTPGDPAARVRALCPDGVDALLDLTGDPGSFTARSELVRDGGIAVSPSFGAPPELLAGKRITAVNFMMEDKPALLAAVTAEVAAGRIRVPVHRSLELEEVPGALAASARGARGKTVVRVS